MLKALYIYTHGYALYYTGTTDPQVRRRRQLPDDVVQPWRRPEPILGGPVCIYIFVIKLKVILQYI